MKSTLLDWIGLALALEAAGAALFGIFAIIRSSLPNGSGHSLQDWSPMLLVTAITVLGMLATFVAERKHGGRKARAVIKALCWLICLSFAGVLVWTLFFPSRV